MFFTRGFGLLLSLTLSLGLLGGVLGFDASRKDNVGIQYMIEPTVRLLIHNISWLCTSEATPILFRIHTTHQQYSTATGVRMAPEVNKGCLSTVPTTPST